VSKNTIKSCAVCGRRIQISVELLETLVSCPHCQASFSHGAKNAPRDSSDVESAGVDSEVKSVNTASDLMARVNNVLKRDILNRTKKNRERLDLSGNSSGCCTGVAAG
jgi:ribosome-binding protein aMBF1 (putative translation factor)